MKTIVLIIFIFNLINLSHAEIPAMEETKVIAGVKVGTAKKGDVRHFLGEVEHVFDANIEVLFASVMDFESRCNNDYKEQRRFMDKSKNCKHMNKNMIETIVEMNTKYHGPKEENETDRFLMRRYISNRGNYEHNELAKVYKFKNEKGQDVIKLDYKMISDDEAKTYLDKIAKRETAFIETDGLFILTKISDTQTHLYYRYHSSTDHWFLNKSMVVGDFFENMSKNMNDLFENFKVDIVDLVKK